MEGNIKMDLQETECEVALGGLVVSVLAIGRKFRRFKPGRERWNFRGYKIRSTTSFGCEMKTSTPCKILRHVKEPYSMKTETSWAKFTDISRQISAASHIGVSAGYCQRALVDESGMIITQMGTHNRSEIVAVHGTAYVIPPHNSNRM
jgi:hypothetical protein